MKNYEISRFTPEEIKEHAVGKLVKAEDVPDKFFTIWISQNLIGFGARSLDLIWNLNTTRMGTVL